MLLGFEETDRPDDAGVCRQGQSLHSVNVQRPVPVMLYLHRAAFSLAARGWAPLLLLRQGLRATWWRLQRRHGRLHRRLPLLRRRRRLCHWRRGLHDEWKGDATGKCWGVMLSAAGYGAAEGQKRANVHICGAQCTKRCPLASAVT